MNLKEIVMINKSECQWHHYGDIIIIHANVLLVASEAALENPMLVLQVPNFMK